MNKKKGLGAKDFFFIGFGSIIGIGWALYVNSWIVRAGGVIPAVAGYLIGTALIIPVALCYAELAPMLPVAGGVVAYGQRAFGPKISFLGGWMLAAANVFCLMWEALFLADIGTMMFPSLTSGDPLYTFMGVGVWPMTLVIAIGITLIVGWINIRGAQSGSFFQNLMTIALLTFAVVCVIAMFLKGDVSNLQPLYANVSGGDYSHGTMIGGILTVLAIVPYFMDGVDVVPMAVEEADTDFDYKKVGIVIVCCIGAVGIFYSLVILACGVAVPWTEFANYPTPAAPLIFKSGIYSQGVGNFLYWLLLASVVTGLVTTMNAITFCMPRMLMAMARARLLPSFFGKIHPKYKTPYLAIIFAVVVTIIGTFFGLGLIDPLNNVISISDLIAWSIACFSLVALRKKEPTLKRPFKIPGGVAMAVIAGVICLIWAVVEFIPSLPSYMGEFGMIVAAIWIVIGILFYAGTSKYRNAVSDEERCAVLYQRLREDKEAKEE